MRFVYGRRLLTAGRGSDFSVSEVRLLLDRELSDRELLSEGSETLNVSLALRSLRDLMKTSCNLTNSSMMAKECYPNPT